MKNIQEPDNSVYEDERLLDRELDESAPELRRLAKGLLRDAVQAPDPEAEWEKFHVRLRLREPRRRPIILAAAACAVAVVAVAAAILLQKPGDVENVSDSMYSEVGSVTLETSGGHSYALDAQGGDALAAAGGELRLADTATIAYSATDAGAPIEYHKLSTPRAKAFSIVLSDGTTVYLNACSVLEYPSRFTGGEREVKLQGEAYFDVARDPQHPFVVKTQRMETRVLGTEFNVSSYAGYASSVTLVEGSVEVADADGANARKLVPGDCATMMRTGAFAVAKVDTDALKYWKEGYFYFDNRPLSAILDKVGEWYGVEVKYVNPSSRRHRLHLFVRRDEGIGEVITQLNEIDKVKVVLHDDVIIVE